MSEKVENKRTFEVELDGKKVQFAVVRPNHKVAQEAVLVYNRAFREAVQPADGKKGAIVRQAVENVLREQKLWDDAKQAKYEKAVKGLLAGERKLAEGGIKLSAGRDIALQMLADRGELRDLSAARNEYDAVTAESQAQQVQFNFYVAACTVYGDTGERYFKDVDDMLARQNDPVVNRAGEEFGKLYYNLDDEYEQKLPEVRFLLKYKFAKVVNGKVRLIDRNGDFVDAKGRRVDDKGRLINAKGELIDADGNLLTEDGEYKVEFKGFEDDVFVPAPAAPAGEQASETAQAAA